MDFRLTASLSFQVRCVEEAFLVTAGNDQAATSNRGNILIPTSLCMMTQIPEAAMGPQTSIWEM